MILLLKIQKNMMFVIPYCSNYVTKKFTKKAPQKSLPAIPLTRSQRFIKRQEMYEQMLKECTKEEYDEIKKRPITFQGTGK